MTSELVSPQDDLDFEIWAEREKLNTQKLKSDNRMYADIKTQSFFECWKEAQSIVQDNARVATRAAASTRSPAGVPDAGGALTDERIPMVHPAHPCYGVDLWMCRDVDVEHAKGQGYISFDEFAAQRAAPLPDAALIDAARELIDTISASRAATIADDYATLVGGECGYTRSLRKYAEIAVRLRSALAPPAFEPAEHKGFWVKTPDGNTMHVHGDPNMSEETLTALQNMMELAVKQFAPAPPPAPAAEGETK